MCGQLSMLLNTKVEIDMRHFLIIIMTVFSLSGCQSAYYSAMEKVGTHKRDILVTRVENATDSQEEAKQEFQDALEQFSSLINFDGGELQLQYEKSKDHYQASKEAADEVTDRISAIEDVANALFDEWSDEIEEYSNQSFKRESQLQLKSTKRRYLSVIKSMQKSEASMFPVLAALKDNMLYLKHNLNANAIGALKGEFGKIQTDVNVLIKQMNQSIEDSQQFINTLKEN